MKGEGVVGAGFNLDVFVFATAVLDVERMQVVLFGQFVESGVLCVIELIPRHGDLSFARMDAGRRTGGTGSFGRGPERADGFRIVVVRLSYFGKRIPLL